MNAISPEPPPACFVLAPSFHGTTLLALLLNTHPEAVALGDTNPPRSGTNCYCGRAVDDCPFWTELRGAVSPWHFPWRQKMLPTVPTLTSNVVLDTRLTAAIAMASIHTHMNVWRLAHRSFDEYALAWAAFREAAIKASGARVMVDGEKSTTKFLAFRSLRELTVRVIHVTRDPRAFAYSMVKHAREQGRPEITLDHAVGFWRRGHRNILRASRVSPRISICESLMKTWRCTQPRPCRVCSGSWDLRDTTRTRLPRMPT